MTTFMALFGQAFPFLSRGQANSPRWANPHVGRTDAELEAAIDAAGRDEVFDHVHALGWGGSPPPKFVWWAAVAHVHDRKAGSILGSALPK